MPIEATFTSQFDKNGNRRELATSLYNGDDESTTNDFKNTYTYDALNRLSDIVQQAVGGYGANSVAAKHVHFAYDLASQLDSITRYASTGTTGAVAYSDYTFDAAGRVTQIDHHQGSSGSGDRIDGYDLVWNSRNLLEQFNFIPTAYAGESATYAYDPRGQLVGATYSRRPMKRTTSTPMAIGRRSPMTAIPAA